MTLTAPRRRRRRAPVIAGAIAIVVALFMLVLATTQPATTKVGPSPPVGRAAPQLAGTTIDDGAYVLPARPGQWVLVNFFATWCVPCRREHPDLIRFADRHHAAGDVAVVGVNSDVRRFRVLNGANWPMLLDPGGATAVSFGVSGVPESFVIDPDGLVVAKLIGGVRDDELETFFQRLRATTR